MAACRRGRKVIGPILLVSGHPYIIIAIECIGQFQSHELQCKYTYCFNPTLPLPNPTLITTICYGNLIHILIWFNIMKILKQVMNQTAANSGNLKFLHEYFGFTSTNKSRFTTQAKVTQNILKYAQKRKLKSNAKASSQISRTRIEQSFVGHFQQHSQLRIHAVCLFRMDAKERGVKFR